MANPGETGNQQIELRSETSINIRPSVEQRLISVASEQEKRSRLLNAVSTTENGIGYCINPHTNVLTLVAAVKIEKVGDQEQATLIQFEQMEDGSHTLYLPVTKGVPTKIGFFLGYKSPDGMSVVLRNGEYPGKALNKTNKTDNAEAENSFSLTGIRENETAEARYADQIGLFSELGFETSRTRGIFVMGHRKDPESDLWEDRDLVLMPKQQLETLPHYDQTYIAVNEIQVLTYGTKEQDLQASFLDEFDEFITLRGDFDETFEDQPSEGGVGLGFGASQQRDNPTTESIILDLEAAFRIIAIDK